MPVNIISRTKKVFVLFLKESDVNEKSSRNRKSNKTIDDIIPNKIRLLEGCIFSVIIMPII